MGTGLLLAAKEQPKEMLLVFARGSTGDLCLKPIVQLVFERFDSGLAERGMVRHRLPGPLLASAGSILHALITRAPEGPVMTRGMELIRP